MEKVQELPLICRMCIGLPRFRSYQNFRAHMRVIHRCKQFNDAHIGLYEVQPGSRYFLPEFSHRMGNFSQHHGPRPSVGASAVQNRSQFHHQSVQSQSETPENPTFNENAGMDVENQTIEIDVNADMQDSGPESASQNANVSNAGSLQHEGEENNPPANAIETPDDINANVQQTASNEAPKGKEMNVFVGETGSMVTNNIVTNNDQSQQIGARRPTARSIMAKMVKDEVTQAMLALRQALEENNNRLRAELNDSVSGLFKEALKEFLNDVGIAIPGSTAGNAGVSSSQSTQNVLTDGNPSQTDSDKELLNVSMDEIPVTEIMKQMDQVCHEKFNY